MFYYIDKPHTQSFHIGLVKSESSFIVRSVETGLGRWTLVVTVVSVVAYLFLAFSDLTCHIEDTGIGVFWFQGPWVSFVTIDDFSERFTKITSKIGVS